MSLPERLAWKAGAPVREDRDVLHHAGRHVDPIEARADGRARRVRDVERRRVATDESPVAEVRGPDTRRRSAGDRHAPQLLHGNGSGSVRLEEEDAVSRHVQAVDPAVPDRRVERRAAGAVLLDLLDARRRRQREVGREEDQRASARSRGSRAPSRRQRAHWCRGRCTSPTSRRRPCRRRCRLRCRLRPAELRHRALHSPDPDGDAPDREREEDSRHYPKHDCKRIASP